MRRCSYKPTINDDERKQHRAKTSLNIRKDKREQHVRMKRGQASSFSGSIVVPGIGNTNLIAVVCSCDAPVERKLVATKQLRRLSQEGENHGFDTRFLSHCVAHMQGGVGIVDQIDSKWCLALESAWVLSNTLHVKKDKEAAAYAIAAANAGAIGSLAMLLKDPQPSMYSMAALCLGNIASHGVQLRDQILRHNVTEQLYVSVVDYARRTCTSLQKPHECFPCHSLP